jgi:hypothetical protein
VLCSRCKYGFEKISDKAENGIVMDTCEVKSSMWANIGKYGLMTLLLLGVAGLIYYMVKDIRKKRKSFCLKKFRRKN